MYAWVLGAGGLLGYAILREARKRVVEGSSSIHLHESSFIPWSHEAEAIQVLQAEMSRFAYLVGDEPWAIVWAAGSSVVASDERQTTAELRMFTAVTDCIKACLSQGRGVFFVTSSAGGVYAGSQGSPFGVESLPAPTSPYGHLKLAQEFVAAESCSSMCSVVIGRFSNLYGPARHKDKQQGLIQLLCRSTMQRAALNLYVPMNTVRDYLFIDDAARLVWAAIERSLHSQTEGAQTLLLANGTGVSVAEVIATVQTVTHRRVPLALGSNPASARQPLDLRFKSSLTSDELGSLTPLPVGIRRVFDSLLGGVA